MVTVRNAHKNDINCIVDFQFNMAEEVENLILDKNVITPGVEAVLQDANKGRYFIAEYQADVAGSLLITYEWSDWRNGLVLWIQSVYIKSEYRGKGVFKALYIHVQKMVNNNPERYKGYIRLYVDKTNVNAQKVYGALGMNRDHYDMYEWMG